MTEDEIKTLEAQIDAYGLDTVLHTIAAICSDKSAHIAENWQAVVHARRWSDVADRAENIALIAEGL